ncbi:MULTISPECIES: hypothetical protein [unclassified Caballeronia]|uniref:hypothetical protein n=1 Tax=unclassified Caballeronia TaxID=2646786 RepID=UPI00158E489F|nr:MULTISPECIES: hypothetical protein [unclassified Caballeronia]QSN61868.1 hypothetical protein JYK05_02840 [Caballeronia sp. M1242]
MIDILASLRQGYGVFVIASVTLLTVWSVAYFFRRQVARLEACRPATQTASLSEIWRDEQHVVIGDLSQKLQEMTRLQNDLLSLRDELVGVEARLEAEAVSFSRSGAKTSAATTKSRYVGALRHKRTRVSSAG